VDYQSVTERSRPKGSADLIYAHASINWSACKLNLNNNSRCYPSTSPIIPNTLRRKISIAHP